MNPLEILFEDNHLLIVNKPSGMLVQKDKEGAESTLEDVAKSYIKEHEQKPGNVYLGIPHRIDRPTQGIVILCKSSKSLLRMNEQFQNKTIKKTYWAVIPKSNIPEQGELIHYLKRSEKQNISLVKDTPTDGYKKAELYYKVLSQIDHYMLAEVDLKTGRHHQIRAQFSHIGCPLKGDDKYGFKRGNEDRSIDLLARKVLFLHPVTKEKIELFASPKNDVIWNKLIDNI